MSDVDSESGSTQDDDVCRDFMRNVCSRGRKCRFKHPTKTLANFTGDAGSTKEERLKFIRLFCHDFQNTTCVRDECKFIHCSKEDEEYFLVTGLLPPYVLEDAITKSVVPSVPDQGPVCRDYLSGECRRGKACRFRHLSHSKYRKELDFLFGVEANSSDNGIDSGKYEYASESKRFKPTCLPCVGDVSFLPMQGTIISQGYFPHEKCKIHGAGFYLSADRCSQGHFNGTCRLGHPTQETPIVLCAQQDRSLSLQDENTILKKRVLDLKKQLSDLTAANEFLLDQNAQLRLGRKNGVGVTGVAGVTPVSVTVQPMAQAAGQLVAGTTQGQQLVPVSIAPGSLAGGVPASGHGQQLISTGALSTVTVAGQTSTGQLVTAAVPVSCNATAQIVTVAGQSGAGPQQLVTPAAQQLVPVSLATAVPVTISAVSVAPVHIPPPIVTVAQPPPNPPLSGPPHGQSLVSYPIMTQPVLQTSLPR